MINKKVSFEKIIIEIIKKDAKKDFKKRVKEGFYITGDGIKHPQGKVNDKN